MSKQIGPKITVIPQQVEMSCRGCDYLERVDESVEDGNSYDYSIYYYCKHPSFDKRKIITSYGGPKTKEWCPELEGRDVCCVTNFG